MESKGNIQDIKIKNRMRRIRTEIARELIDGPRSIFPWRRIDDFGWLEPVMQITIGGLEIDKICSSFSIYVDNTINRDENFLTPIVRFAIWDRPKEYRAKRFKKWPEVKIFQHGLTKEEQENIDYLLKLLDTKISNIQFAVGGLITDRSNPPLPDESFAGFRQLSFKRWNSCQTIEFFFGEDNNLNNELEEIVRKISCYIRELCKSPMKKSYRERYNLNLKNLYDFFDNVNFWDFRPPKA